MLNSDSKIKSILVYIFNLVPLEISGYFEFYNPIKVKALISDMYNSCTISIPYLKQVPRSNGPIFTLQI